MTSDGVRTSQHCNNGDKHSLSFTGTFYIGTFRCGVCNEQDNLINRGAQKCSKCEQMVCIDCHKLKKIPKRIKSVTFTEAPPRMNEERKTPSSMSGSSKKSPKPRLARIKRAQSSNAFAVLEGRVSILVSDLSGFTRSTRKYGIIHFGSIIIRMRQLVRPIFSLFDCQSVEYEGDDCIVVFPDEISAMYAACAMKHTLDTYNESLPEDQKHFSINLGGIGLANGSEIIKDFYGHLYGEGADVAFDLGEEVADKEILMSEDFAKVLKSELSIVSDLKLQKKTEDDIDDFYSICGNLSEIIKTSPKQLDQPFADLDDSRYIGRHLCLFASRFNPNLILEQTDRLIRDQYLRPATILFFKFDLPDHSKKYGARETLNEVHKMLAMLKPIYLKHGGIKVETWMRLFDDEEDAVRCTTEVQQIIFDYNKKHSSNGQVSKNLELCGFGIHSGQIVYVEDTDVHWGDPVNTASKLGEDLAENGEILLSKKVYLTSKHLLNDKHVTKRNLTVSKVDFEAYSIFPKEE